MTQFPTEMNSYTSYALSLQGFAAKYIKEYVDGSGCTDDLNVGELWVDLAWGDNGKSASF